MHVSEILDGVITFLFISKFHPNTISPIRSISHVLFSFFFSQKSGGGGNPLPASSLTRSLLETVFCTDKHPAERQFKKKFQPYFYLESDIINHYTDINLHTIIHEIMGESLFNYYSYLFIKIR